MIRITTQVSDGVQGVQLVSNWTDIGHQLDNTLWASSGGRRGGFNPPSGLSGREDASWKLAVPGGHITVSSAMIEFSSAWAKVPTESWQPVQAEPVGVRMEKNWGTVTPAMLITVASAVEGTGNRWLRGVMGFRY